MTNRYAKSEQFLERALNTIPLGSQTFSKSKTALPLGASPFFVHNANGSRIWDVDGNEYVDFVNGLACVTLGYCDPDVDAAVTAQMKNGVTFSLSHPLEFEVAELLVEMIPCAEMVRFAKNGTDATSAAVRVARAITGRDRVAFCGYHGWQDWYIGATSRNLGVPEPVRQLSHQFAYNDLAALETLLEKYRGEFSAIILEPMNSKWPEPGFLEGVRELSNVSGTLLIFDETITGFRYHEGGAQAFFNVTPDLATFGKGIANGYPLSALVGKAEYMNVVEKIFFSGTFGGETLSLAAAKASLKKVREKQVIERLSLFGQSVFEGVMKLLKHHKLEDCIQISGHPSWSFLQFGSKAEFSDWEIKTIFLQEVFKRGVFTLGTHNISFAHNDADLQILLSCYNEVFALISKGITDGTLRQSLSCKPLQPLFKIR